MRPNSFLFTLFLLLTSIIVGCSSKPIPIPVVVKPVKPPAFIAPPGKVELRGTLSLYKGSGRFQTCAGETLYWFDNSNEIRALYDSMVQKPGEQVYIEFSGNFNQTPKDYADEFIAQVNVLKLHHMANVRDSLACQRQQKSGVTAFGLYDEWQANITDKLIFLKSKSENWTKTLNSSKLERGGSRVWQAYSPAGNAVMFKVTEEPCIMKTSKAYWSYSSQYFAGQENKGCANIPMVNVQGDFLGHYSGILPMKGKKIEFNFSLHADYSVKADFVFSKDNKPLQQVGFWQPISEKQLLLTLINKNNSAYSNQFLLNWAPDKLSTKDQGLNGISHVIAGGLDMWLMDVAYEHGALDIEKRTFIPKDLSYNKTKSAEVEAALLNYFSIHRTEPNGMKYNYNYFDLNGDGKEDLLIQLNWCSKAGCTLLIFENMGNKYRFVSRTTDVHNSLLLSSAVNHKWQQLLARKGNEYVLLEYDGIGYPISTKTQPVSPRPLPLAGITLFSAPEPVRWYHALPQ